MSTAMILALVSSVALLFTTAYFIMGSIPLLLLKHDTPVDARFVRGFFSVYYVGAFGTAVATSLSFGFAGHLWIAVGGAALAMLAIVLRRRIIPKMEMLGAEIAANPMRAIPGFRKTHVAAIIVNVVQLAAIVISLGAVSVASMPH